MITFDHVCKTYANGVHAVRDLSMTVAQGETVVLLGTSGCGKTTTMKLVNRMIDPTSGRVLVDGVDIMDHDVIQLRRSIGYAIQHIGLFEHMSIAENISVVPRLLKWSNSKIANRVDELLELVGLVPDDFRDRYPSQLSGGQKQRVGVARALAADPPIILMDEPFGALDPITREQLQNEFIELKSQIEKTILFVTHDVFEAVRMGDRIALLDAGNLQQLSSPAELVENPANEFVNQFLGSHRFQLSLLTRTIKNTTLPLIKLSTDLTKSDSDLRLSTRSSLIDALDMFKRNKKDTLEVYAGKKYQGSLNKADLLKEITAILGSSKEAAL